MAPESLISDLISVALGAMVALVGFLLHRLLAQVDKKQEEQDEKLTSQAAQIDDHEKRIKAMEQGARSVIPISDGRSA